MATLKVTAPFTVQLDPVLPPEPGAVPVAGARTPEDPTAYHFPAAGTYEDVPDEVANHWYTQTFLEEFEPPEDEEVSGVVVMTPAAEPPPTEEEAAAILSTEQKSQLRQQRLAEARAARAAQKTED